MSKEKGPELFSGVVEDDPTKGETALTETKTYPKAIAEVPMVMTSQELITYALTNDKLDALDKLIALKNAEEDRANKKEFAAHFAEMQREFPPVYRDGEVKGRDGSHKYNYISLDAILKVYSPIIARHGFAFRWHEEEIKEGKEKRVWCIVSGYGHEEKTYVDMPILAATDFTNAAQQRGSTTTYGKRYSFMNLFGVIVADEDDDAASFEDGVKLAQYFTLIRESKTHAECKTNYMLALKTEGMTDREKGLIAAETKKRRKELQDAGVTE